MKTKILIIAAAIVTAVVAVSCDRYYDGYYDPEYYNSSTDFMTLRNFSSDTTVWFIPEKEHAQTLPESLSEWQKISIYELGPHSAMTLSFDSEDSYVTPVETYSTTDKLAIYVFPKTIWRTHTWDELVSGKMWTGKCSYSVDEMVDLKQIVTYPMRDTQ